MADNPINMFDPWGADPEGGGGGATSAPSSESSSSPSSNSSDGSSGSSSGGKSGGKSGGGGISPKSINKDPDKFKEGERLFSGPFETDLMFHDGLFYHEQKYRSLVQDLVDSYGDGKAFDEKLSTFANENGFSENFIEIYAEQGRETYGGNEKIGDLGLKNPFINFGLESNDYEIIGLFQIANDITVGIAKGVLGKKLTSIPKSLVFSYPPVAEVGETSVRLYLRPGLIIDRYGLESGKWFSLPGVSYGARVLPPGITTYTKYRVLKPFEVISSLAAPNFLESQIGFGIQFKSAVNVEILLKRGIIEVVK